MLARVGALARDALQNVRLRFFAEAIELRHFAGLASRFQFFNRIHAEIFIQCLNFFGAEAGNFQHRDQSRRNRSLQLVVVF